MLRKIVDKKKLSDGWQYVANLEHISILCRNLLTYLEDLKTFESLRYS